MCCAGLTYRDTHVAGVASGTLFQARLHYSVFTPDPSPIYLLTGSCACHYVSPF